MRRTISRTARHRAGRIPGLLAVLAIVVLGILPGAGYLHWRAPEVRADIKGRMEAAPRDPAERLAFWLWCDAPYIQGRLTHLRMSGEQPWLVTHTVQGSTVQGASGEPEIWGIDLSSPSPGRIVAEGMRVEVHLPAPRMLGSGVVRGNNAHRVPSYAARELAPDPARRAEELVHWFLGGMMEGLAEDIPGAELALVIDP